MKVRYKCNCMADEVEILVTDRHPDGDLMPWMNLLTVAVTVDHGARSPRCRATALEYLKIPLASQDAPIGVPTQ